MSVVFRDTMLSRKVTNLLTHSSIKYFVDVRERSTQSKQCEHAHTQSLMTLLFHLVGECIAAMGFIDA